MRHFEVRRYRPVMRHLVLSMVSLLFFCEEVARLRGEEPMAEGQAPHAVRPALTGVVEHLAGQVRRRRAG